MLHCDKDGVEKDKDNYDPVERLGLDDAPNLELEPFLRPPESSKLTRLLLPLCTIERKVT